MKSPITKNGFKKLKDELDRLKKHERPKVIQDIAEARAHGDLSENAEYTAAKEKQSFIEGKIMEIETKLVNSHIIDTNNLSAEKVVFGATVRLRDTEENCEKKYMIVGLDEADLKEGKISVQSPVARALIGHRIGDVVTITAPAKVMEYEIMNISFE